jgi:NarL family two-component system response regulator LiaR
MPSKNEPHNNQSPIMVAIADDHEMVRMSLRIFLQMYSDIEVIGEATNGAEALALCTQLNPDIILMDYVMPEMDGVEAANLLREQCPNVQVILLTATVSTDLAPMAYDAGVACLLKKDPSFELHDAIQNVYEHGSCH